ncbi:MAG TPA: hypothetical protein PKA64_08495 [Myxococcota bacterium]|nr:hypothetical protein [Myxococcota bacterium]
MSARLPWTLLLAGCGLQERWAELREVPRLDTIEPAVARPGQSVVLVGEHLDRATGLDLRATGERLALDLRAEAPDRATVVLPADLPSAPWAVALRGTGLRAPQGGAALEVWRGDTEPPCTKRYALKVQTERLGRRVAIERQYPDGEVEKLSFAGAELGAIDRTVVDGCAALWLVTSDGRRLLLADDPAADLVAPAEALAAALELPLGSVEP